MRTWAHNTELSILAEMGPLGLAALLWVVAAAARALLARVRAREPIALGALAALAALLVVGAGARRALRHQGHVRALVRAGIVSLTGTNGRVHEAAAGRDRVKGLSVTRRSG